MSKDDDGCTCDCKLDCRGECGCKECKDDYEEFIKEREDE